MMFSSGGLGGVFAILFSMGAIIGWIIFLVAVWRGMKAHESIATSASLLLDEMTRRSDATLRPPGGG